MPTARHGATRPGLREVWALWALFALVALEIFATYARLPVHHLYHVSGDGRVAGAGRAVVFLNFPVALVAIALAAVVASDAGSRTIDRLAVTAVVLCAAVVWPGVVDEADLDAKWINAVAASGVLLTFALTVAVTRRDGVGPRRRLRGDRIRVAVAVLLLLVALPWIAADLGFLIGRWPVFGSIFYSDEWYAPLGHARLTYAVHTGHHHGMDGTLLALTAILLSRTLGRIGPRLRAPLGAYLGLMLVYGLGNVANDAWYEQVVKRGVTSWAIPNVIVPGANLPWLVILVLAAVAYVLFFRKVTPGERIADRRLLLPTAVQFPLAALLVIGLLHGEHRHATPHGLVNGIVFSAAPKLTPHLYVMHGGKIVQLTNDPKGDLAPAWSPDRRRVAFQSSREGNSGIYLINADGSGLRRLTDGDAAGEPAWSPDGKRIAFVRDGDLYIMSADGSAARRIADDAAWPTWSRDGRSLAYEVELRGHHAIAVSGPGASLSPYGATDARYPAWSPRGDVIAYECLLGGHWHICLLNPHTGSRHAITGGHSDEFAPAWSPDGRRLAFVGDRDGTDQIFVMTVDGTATVRLTSGQSDKDTPAWAPR